MSSLWFALKSEEQARFADRALRGTGLDERHVRHVDRFSYLQPSARAVTLPPEIDHEIAQGHVILEIDVDDARREAVERLMAMLGATAPALMH